MKKQLPVLALLLLTQACSLQDHVTPEPVVLPQAVAKIIDNQYPGHSKLAASELESGKIFAVHFKNDGNTYKLIANRTQILEALHQGGALPDSLKKRIEGTVLQGGDFGNRWIGEEIFPYGSSIKEYNLTDYTFDGVTYTARMYGSFGAITERINHLYRTTHSDDLPDKIQQFLDQRSKPNAAAIAALPLLDSAGKSHLSKNNELKFVSATGWVLYNGKRYYEVSVKYFDMTQLQLLFDQNSDLVWSSSFAFLERWPNLTAPTSFATNLNDSQIDELKAKLTPWNTILEFTADKSISTWQDHYAGATSYSALFNHTFAGSSQESWSLRYDAGKNLIWRTFNY